MKILRIEELPAQEIGAFGSIGASYTGMFSGSGELKVSRIAIEPGGKLGSHPAPVPQTLVLIQGEGTVQGADGRQEHIRAGEAAIWESGEVHETRSAGGLRAIVIEGLHLSD